MPIKKGLLYPKWLFYIFSTAVVMTGWFGLIDTKSDNATAVLWGLSLFRLALSGAILVIGGLIIFLAYQEMYSPTIIERKIDRYFILPGSKWQHLSVVVTIYFTFGYLLFPSDQIFFFPSAFERMKPVIFIIFGLSLNYYLWFIINNSAKNREFVKDFISSQKKQLIPGLIFFGCFIILLIIVNLTQIGIKPDLYWKVAGVPLLSFQLYLILGSIFAYSFIDENIITPFIKKNKISSNTIQLTIFLFIWISASLIWIQTPQERSVFAPGPYPPAGLLFPHSDAAVHDSGGEMLTVGLPLNNGQYTDKPAYMFLLGILHLILGDNQTAVVNGQVILLALFPAIFYLLGKELYSQRLGLFIALIAIARADNAIRAVTQITTVSVKEFMSEMPLALVLCSLSLFVIKYLKTKDMSTYPICIGGMYGISILIRPHPLLFAPFLLILFVVKQWKQRRQMVRDIAFFLIPLIFVLAPISISNMNYGRKPDYLWKINNVLFYRGNIQSVQEEDNSVLETITLTTTPIPSNNSIQIQTASPVQQNLAITQTIPSIPTEPTAIPEIVLPAIVEPPPTINNKALQLVSHFIHNEFTIILSLPSSFIFNNLAKTLSVPYWVEKPVWDGKLPAGQWLSITINLFILSLGFANFLNKAKIWGLVPLIIQVIINIANSIARSSGGRFLVPVDWAIYLYYAIGLFELCILIGSCFNKNFFVNKQIINQTENLTNREDKTHYPKLKWLPFGSVMIVFLAFGISMVLINQLVPQKYPISYDISDVISQNGAEELVNSEIPNFQEIVNTPNISTLYGKALYPRFYEANGGEPSHNSELSKQPYSRLTYQVIGPEGNRFVNLPLAIRGKKLVHGSSVLVVGCKTDENSFDALYLIIFGEQGNSIYKRDKNQPFTCN